MLDDRKKSCRDTVKMGAYRLLEGFPHRRLNANCSRSSKCSVCFPVNLFQFFYLSAGTGTRPAVPPPGTRTGPGPRTAVPVIPWILHSYIGSFSLRKIKEF